MTRVAVYSAALVALIAATAMAFTAIATPYWVSYTAHNPAGDVSFIRSLGLHRSCTTSSLSSSASSAGTTVCRPFPASDPDECAGSERTFCSMWRTTGFLMNLAAVVELVCLVGFVVILWGGKARREAGWRVMGGLMGVVAGLQVASVVVVAYLFDNDDKFLVPGWRLGSSWILCTVGASIAALSGLGLALSAWLLPPEDGYEFLPDPAGV